ncbi:MAG: peroxiredoxin family protein, partial [bacterium]
MKKFVPPVFLFVLAGFVLFSWLSRSNSNEFKTELMMESDAMAIVNYYYPKRIILTPTPAEANLQLPEFKTHQPLFGALIIGNSADSVVTLVLDESQQDNFSYFYIDKNNNEDLTDDGDPFWDDNKNDYWSKEELVDVYYKDDHQKAAVPYPITFYRYKRRFRDSIVAFRDGYREGTITLKDSTYKIALLDDDLNGLFRASEKGALIIDVNRDGILNGHTDSPEFFLLTSLFNVNGITYRIKNISPPGDLITLAIADTMVRPKIVVTAGLRAPLFRTTAIDGQVIDLEEFKNKVVLLDFWATWCKPWQKELANLKRNFNRYHYRGFEIIGLNLDYDLDQLLEF